MYVPTVLAFYLGFTNKHTGSGSQEPVPVTDLMTGRNGNVRAVALDKPAWIRQLETDVGFTADAAWDMASDRQLWGGGAMTRRRSSGPVSE